MTAPADLPKVPPAPSDMLESAISAFLLCYVSRPDRLRIQQTQGSGAVLLEIICHPDDIGRIKGRMVAGRNKRLDLIQAMANEISSRYRMRPVHCQVIDGTKLPPEADEAEEAHPAPLPRRRRRLVRPPRQEARS